MMGKLSIIRISFIFALISLSVDSGSAACNFVELVKCFIEVLDQWAFALYKSRENIVTIVEHDGCEHYQSISKCVEDTAATKHNCNKKEIMEASRTVSDLLTHRKHSGTFLKSYYLVEYSCGMGRETVVSQLECLKSERIGPESLAASAYLDQELHRGLKPSDPYSVSLGADEACTLLTNKLTEFQQIIGEDLCEGIAQSLMCKSLFDMFRNVYPEVLGNCQFDCDKKKQLPPTEETIPVAESNGAAEQTGNRQPEAGGGAEKPANGDSHMVAISSQLLLFLWFLVLLFRDRT